MLIAATVLAGGVAACAPSPSADTVTLTLVRHGQSAGNATGLMDTSVPGPNLTPLGEAQAEMIANRLRSNDFDGVYASTMVRTQESAQPMADYLDRGVTTLPGLREIDAGSFEGQPESTSAKPYYGTVVDWTEGAVDERIPGSVDGNEFDARFDDAVDQIIKDGSRNAVAYSHGAAIAAWTMLNVDNADPQLMLTEPLPNTGYVVVSHTNGRWHLDVWNGREIGS
ncbi:histidine phosphatase family protein [Mycolicibacterium neoaurum]|uniref:histidine phosphatase family protein n=1 Tax=Mycolicibacterium neoaurum TaxID=1795 RepID=UPI002674136E|nr:histidine phosphatase family protein [Mycolicibacterium neoaurum]MDO3402722.1 histidine phosphatase family protein [Mycolicibacterium neoaurum]